MPNQTVEPIKFPIYELKHDNDIYTSFQAYINRNELITKTINDILDYLVENDILDKDYQVEDEDIALLPRVNFWDDDKAEVLKNNSVEVAFSNVLLDNFKIDITNKMKKAEVKNSNLVMSEFRKNSKLAKDISKQFKEPFDKVILIFANFNQAKFEINQVQFLRNERNTNRNTNLLILDGGTYFAGLNDYEERHALLDVDNDVTRDFLALFQRLSPAENAKVEEKLRFHKLI